MAICQSCSRNLKWYQFRREICPDCAKHWNNVLASTKAASFEDEDDNTIAVAEDRNKMAIFEDENRMALPKARTFWPFPRGEYLGPF